MYKISEESYMKQWQKTEKIHHCQNCTVDFTFFSQRRTSLTNWNTSPTHLAFFCIFIKGIKMWLHQTALAKSMKRLFIEEKKSRTTKYTKQSIIFLHFCELIINGHLKRHFKYIISGSTEPLYNTNFHSLLYEHYLQMLTFWFLDRAK